MAAGREVTLQGISGNVIELLLRIDPEAVTEVGVKVLCSPDDREQRSIPEIQPGRRPGEEEPPSHTTHTPSSLATMILFIAQTTAGDSRHGLLAGDPRHMCRHAAN